MISRPEIVDENYSDAADGEIVNMFVVSSSDPPHDVLGVNLDENGVDWDKAGWYFAPQNDPMIERIPEIEKDIDVCRSAHPFISEAGV